MPSRLQVETNAGNPITIGNTRIVPFSKSVRVDMPQIRGGLIWNRPVSILAVDPNGGETSIPIVDTTRRLQIAIFTSGVLFVLFVWLVSQIQRANRRKNHE